MPVLYFIRHGETDWNREGRLQGQTDIPLNARGERQAQAVGQHLLDAASGKLDHLAFYASPLMRTRQTMELLRSHIGLAPAGYALDDRLKEISFGHWEGKTWPEIRGRDPIRAKARDLDKWGFAPPGGENYEMVKERVGEWLATITQDSCIVAHGGIARVMMVLAQCASTHEALSSDIWQGKVLRFERSTACWLPDPGHY